MSAWVALGWLWLLLTLVNLVTGLFMAAACVAAGVRPTVVRFHVGPGLLSFRVAGVRWSFGPLSFGTGITFTPEGQPEDEAHNPYLRLRLGRRLVVIASAALGMLLVAGVCLGPGRALRDFGAGFEQVLNVPLAPERVRAFFALLQSEGFWTAMGVLATKLAVFNLLPLPPMPGFLLLREGLNGLRGKKPSDASSLLIWGLLPTLALTVSWIWGVYQGLS